MFAGFGKYIFVTVTVNMTEHVDNTIEVTREHGKIEDWRIPNLSKSEVEILKELSIEVICGTPEEREYIRRISVTNRRKAIAPECRTNLDNMSATSVKPTQVRDVKAIHQEICELTSKQVEAFREVFNLFGLNGGGMIDAEELEKALHSVDIKLTQEEVRNLLAVIDDDGNGEIDFYEFLQLMTSTEKFLESRDNSKNNSQSILFSALTKFMRETALSSLTEIELYYHNKEPKYPHVVAHYAAGARVIGLTEKQLSIHLANLRFKYKAGDSPYCQPICRLPEEKTKPSLSRKMKGKIKLRVRFPNSKSEETCKEKKDSRVNKRAPQKQNFKRSRKNLPTKLDVKPLARLACVSLVEIAKCKQNSSLTLNFEDVPLIRRKIEQAQNDYHKRIKIKRDKLYKENPHLFDLDVTQVPSNILKFNFSKVLESYGISNCSRFSSDRKFNKATGAWQTLMRVKYGEGYQYT